MEEDASPKNETRPEVGSPPSRDFGRGKLVFGSLLFVGFTVGIFWYQFTKIEAVNLTAIWEQIEWPFGLLILLALPLEPLATGLRLWVVCRMLHPTVSLWSNIMADSANMGLAMITPSQTGGGPAQIYLLHRAGVRVSTALTVSLVGFFGTLVGLLGMGLYSVFFGGAGQRAGALFSVAVWTVTISVTVMLFAAFVPAFFRAPIAGCSRIWARFTGKEHRLMEWRESDNGPVVDHMGPIAAKLAYLLYAYRADVGQFLKRGKRVFLLVVLFTGAFLLARCLMAFLVVRFFGIEVGFGQVLEIQVALIFIVYFAPTPGGAGIAEGASFVAMAAIVPGFVAPFYNLVWRFTTGYLQAFAGLFFVARALAEDGKSALRRGR